jgi:HEAT repeat protein/beta-lactamase regulating signal transducer with metallopeptidase domain
VLNAGWQIAAISVVSALASWLLRNGPARYQHTLWIFALAACVTVPLLTATRYLPEMFSSFQSQTEPSAVAPGQLNIAGSEENSTVDHIGSPRRKTVSTTNRTVLFLAFVYVLFVIARGVRLARFWQRKERLRRSATHIDVPHAIEVAAQRCRELLGTSDATVARSTEARIPYTIGTRRPLIVLPNAFCSTADENRLISVIGHEMAHVARRDFLSNLICELVALPVSFHPLTFLIKREIDRARELACDELVTQRVLAANVYARSLLWAADVSRQYSSQAFMLSIFDGKILEQRIVRLMRKNRRISRGVATAGMFAAIAFLSVSALSLSMFSLDLQTRAQASVTQSIPAPGVSVEQERVTPTVTTAIARNEPQANTISQDQRAQSACNAARRGDVEAIPSLIAMLGDDSKTQLIRCWDTSRWSPALQTFKQSSPGEQAALALASFGRVAFIPLSNQLDSQNATVRRNAAWAIGELTNMLPGERSGAVPQLITLLGDSDEWVRMAAARALGELRDTRALSKLVATLSDDNWRVRELVVWALSEMKDGRAVTALCNVLLSDTRVEVRRGAAEALGEIRSSEALPSLKQALNDSEPRVSAKAAWAISEIEG